MIRKALRLFASGLCGTLCVLLALLSVRSYWEADYLSVTVGRDNVGVESRIGRLLPFYQKFGGSNERWRLGTSVIDESFPQTGHTPFSWHNDLPSYFWLCIPHWFVAVVMGMLAAAPWLRWRRFNIRALLIATTVFAIVMGVAVLHHQLGGME
jgi:hypothetical protein